MNKKQRIALLFTAAAICVMLLFPPFSSTSSSGKTTRNNGYAFIASPPTYVAKIVVSTLAIQVVIAMISGGAVCLALKD